MSDVMQVDKARVEFVRDEYEHADGLFKNCGQMKSLKAANECIEIMHKLIGEMLDINQRQATLLDERDALAARVEELEEAVENINSIALVCLAGSHGREKSRYNIEGLSAIRAHTRKALGEFDAEMEAARQALGGHNDG